MPRNIIEVYGGITSGNWWLQKSQEFLPENKMLKLPAFCALKFEQKGTLLVCSCYASKDSPIDLLTGFPAETLHKEGAQWQETGESNGFTLKAVSTRYEQGQEIVVETEYDFPPGYNGPAYKIRRLWFEAKTLQIKRCIMVFANDQKDMGTFNYASDKLTIDWKLTSGFLSGMNVNFF